MFVNAINTKEVPNVSTDKLSLKKFIYLLRSLVFTLILLL